MGRRRSSDFTLLSRYASTCAWLTAVEEHEHVARIVRIKVHGDPAATEEGLRDEGRAHHLHGGRLPVHLAADSDAEGVGDLDRVGIAGQEARLREAVHRCCPVAPWGSR